MRGGGQQVLDVLGSQVRPQQHHHAETQPAVGDGGEDGGEPPGSARRTDALERGVLRQAQLELE